MQSLKLNIMVSILKVQFEREKCLMLITGRYDRCTECSKYRKYLRTVGSKQKKMATYDKNHYTGSNSSVNYRYLSSELRKNRTTEVNAKGTQNNKTVGK